MDLMPTADQEQIGASVRSFLEKELPMERVRALASERGTPDPAGYEALWRAAGELGFFGLGLPDTVGGAGYGITEEMVLFEELGRVLAPGPWLGSVIGAHALALAGAAPGAAEELRAVLAGRLRIAIVEVDGSDPKISIEGPAGRVGRVSGRRRGVQDLALADRLLVLGEDVVALVTPGEAVRRTPVPSLDPTRPVGHVVLEAAPGLVVTRDAVVAGGLARAAVVLACAEAVGASQRTVEASVEYAKVRTQFDRPIGSFQAVKHRCADMAVRTEVARSATVYATVSVRDEAEDAAFQTSVAKVLAADALVKNANDNVQNHGGMGFTWECDAHLFVKRARSFDLALGGRTAHLDRLVRGFREAAPGA